MVNRRIDQNVNIGGINFWVEGHITADGEFYGDITCSFPVRGEDEQMHPASELYTIGKNRQERPYYEYYITRPSIAGGDETYKKSYSTYAEMLAGKFLVRSVLERII
jgi:hypothetical protein